MVIIDGQQGEGGGQILRTALSLSICTQQPIEINNIRARRPQPGLQQQHVMAVKAAARVCSGYVEGAERGAMTLRFTPGPPVAGHHHFAIGTAGSTTLVFQTLLPALLQADQPSTLILEGGTHNTYAPTFDFLQYSFLPQLHQMGLNCTVKLQKHGFYPKGGGQWQATLQPNSLKPLVQLARGAFIEAQAIALIADIPDHVAKRELDTLQSELRELTPSLKKLTYHTVRLPTHEGPGNCLQVILRYEKVTEVITGFGQRGVRAEAIAQQVAHDVKRYLAVDVPVGEHLADQLLLPLALAGGGEFTTLALSDHTQTNIHIIEQFLPVIFDITALAPDLFKIKLTKKELPSYDNSEHSSNNLF